MAEGYDMLAVPFRSMGGGECWFVLAAASGSSIDLDHTACTDTGEGLPAGWKGRSCDPSANTAPAPLLVLDQADRPIVRLLETQAYEWELDGDNLAELSVSTPLDDTRKQRWLIRRKKGAIEGGQFTVINHLGFSSFKIESDGEDQPLLDLQLEFVSKKLDFDTEYRRMTEDIADFCEQLLLNWEAPTSLKFSADPEDRARLLLEQFLFLRNFLTFERLGRLLEVIERNPHSHLIKEQTWRPAGMARSTDYLSNPAGMLRSWHRKNGRAIPAEVLDVRKEDTHDTPPNRFIKFALGHFRRLCSEVLEHKSTESTIGMEAHDLIQQLDSILAKRFFKDINRLRRLPLDNQTLQKGEGYREVLHAWLLTEAASSLNWTGQEESYHGSTRDVATLYEYWIFLKIHEILDQIPNIERIDNPAPGADHVDSFISENAGEIKICLQSGKQSKSSFIYRHAERGDLRIDLHYERSFDPDKRASSGGSYSRIFRPDYTLSIFPDRYEKEEDAEAEGKVAHLHFDAKYRATQLAQLFGDNRESDEAIDEEKKSAKATSTYQRGDLLKMHTYNDALRQTIGSYVLYPGSGEDKTELRKFHEISPGVGALVMKPGNSNCIETLKGFLVDVFEHQSSQFTQLRYLSDTRYKIIEQKQKIVEEDKTTYVVARKKAPCVLVWMRPQDEPHFRKKGFAYCRAVPEKESKTLDLDLSIQVGSEFIPTGGSFTNRVSKKWRAKIISVRFIAQKKLRKYIGAKGLSSHLSPSSSEHYLLFEFEDDFDFKKLSLNPIYNRYTTDHRKYMAISCTWQEILDAQTESD